MLLAFVMIPLLQKELDTFKDTIWNTHRIRQQKDTALPHGVPDHIYNFPGEYDLEESGRSQMVFPNNIVFMYCWEQWSCDFTPQWPSLSRHVNGSNLLMEW